ncbi:SDR family oxidoreductase [bacterium]|nr:MAG: SDR family oxidoreductase [bacterium]
MEINLKNKVAVVTGAGRGIGHMIASTFLAEGARVVCMDNNSELVSNLRTEMKDRGDFVHIFEGDVRTKVDVTGCISEARNKFGRIDILVNNAGVAPGGYVESLEEDSWTDNIDVNLKGTFLCSQAVIPIMKDQQWGRILNCSSFAAIIPSISMSAYSASKAAVVALTKVMAAELGPWNITVNAYAPGMIPTELNHYADASPATKERLLDSLSIRRWGETSDIAQLVMFLASERASYITGAHLDISGGKFAVQFPQLAHRHAKSGGR